MKTEQTDFRRGTEYQTKKKIFNQIFILQMKLEDYGSLHYQYEIDEVIRAIDNLMEAMIKS